MKNSVESKSVVLELLASANPGKQRGTKTFRTTFLKGQLPALSVEPIVTKTNTQIRRGLITLNHDK